MSTYRGWHFTASATEGRDGWPLQAVEELPKGTEPVLCKAGLHASKRALAALDNAPGPFVSRVRLEGRVVAGDDKACATRRVRLAGPVNASRVLREFACDCAERALLREREAGREPDPRSWAAVEVARRFARGEATQEELDTAWDSAWDSAWAAWAARAAAWAAASAAAWDSASAAAWAARDAARNASAAASAARAAAGAAWNAERERQEEELTRVLRRALRDG